MKNLSFSFILDAIFLFLGSFLLFFIPLSYILEEGATIFCLLLSILTVILFIKLANKRKLKQNLNKKELITIENFKTYLLVQKKEKIESLICALLDKKGVEYKKEDRIYIKNTTLLINFALTKLDLLKTAYEVKEDLLIFCLENNELFSYSKLFTKKITLVTEKELYFALKEENLLPPLPSLFKKKEGLNLKNIFDGLNLKRLFLISISLLFFSLFTPFKIYYLIFSFIFLSLFITSLILKRV